MPNESKPVTDDPISPAELAKLEHLSSPSVKHLLRWASYMESPQSAQSYLLLAAAEAVKLKAALLASRAEVVEWRGRAEIRAITITKMDKAEGFLRAEVARLKTDLLRSLKCDEQHMDEVEQSVNQLAAADRLASSARAVLSRCDEKTLRQDLAVFDASRKESRDAE